MHDTAGSHSKSLKNLKPFPSSVITCHYLDVIIYIYNYIYNITIQKPSHRILDDTKVLHGKSPDEIGSVLYPVTTLHGCPYAHDIK